MYFFKKMCVELSHNSLVTEEDPSEVLERFNRYVKESQPFVFAEYIGEESTLSAINKKSDDETLLTIPFKIFSLERAGRYALLGGSEDFLIYCVLGIENAPGELEYFVFTHETEDGKYSICHCKKDSHEEWCKSLYYFITKSLNTLFSVLNSNKLGVEKVREKIKLKTYKGKNFFKVNRVIHISLKKHQSSVKSITANPIDWDHHWFVRGHWRKINGIGKDREGNYCQQGYTWISAYKKGDLSKELIKKQRLVG